MHNCLTSMHNNSGGNSEIWYAAEFIKCTMYSMSTFSKEKKPTFYYFSEDNLYITFFLASEIDITNQTTLRATLRQPCSLLKVVRVVMNSSCHF